MHEAFPTGSRGATRRRGVGAAAAPRRLPRALYHGLRRALSAALAAVGASFALQAALVHPSEPELHRVRWMRVADVRGWAQPDRWPQPPRRYVLGGDWDRTRVLDFDAYRAGSRNYRAALEIYGEGRPYTETDQYRHLVELLEDGGWHPELGMRGGTMESVHAYFAHLNEVYAAIRKGGYRTQAELRPGTAPEAEVRVLVDRDGALVRAFGGNHRFAFAQLLGLEALPVYVIGVHREWARAQHERFGGDVASAIARGLEALEVPRAG